MHKKPLVGRMLKKLEKQAGVKINLEPDFGYVGQIVCPNGKKHYFRNLKLDLNPMGAAEISKDKDYANYFMAKMGYPTIPGKKFYSDLWAKTINSKDKIKAALNYAKKTGFPVVVKPNSKSCGQSVFVVKNQADFLKAFKQVALVDDIILVQRYIKGNDYRLLVLGDEVVSAYQRKPLEAISDGKKTVEELFSKKMALLKSSKRNIDLSFKDERIQIALKNQELKENTVLGKGRRVQFLFNANLSTGGEAIDVTNDIHTFYEKIAIDLTRDMGLIFCGVDVIIEGDIHTKTKKYYILEINAAPGIDNYFNIGKKQQKMVENIYLKILNKLCKE